MKFVSWVIATKKVSEEQACSSETFTAGETGLEPATTRFGDVDSTIELLA